MYDNFLASFTDVKSKPQKANKNKNANKKEGTSIFNKSKKGKPVLAKKPNNKNDKLSILGTIHKKNIGNKNAVINQPGTKIK